MGSFSIWHWLIVLVIVMLIFGTKKLRNIGQDLGGAVKGFKEGINRGGADKPVEAFAAPQVGGQTIDVEVAKRRKAEFLISVWLPFPQPDSRSIQMARVSSQNV